MNDIEKLKQENAALRDYVTRVIKWLDDFGMHAPIQFGGEGELWEEGFALLGRPRSLPYELESSSDDRKATGSQ